MRSGGYRYNGPDIEEENNNFYFCFNYSLGSLPMNSGSPPCVHIPGIGFTGPLIVVKLGLISNNSWI